ncbi:MAG TPA: DUF3052 domain-containing protein [Candidatus Saccharimonadia bacterium]|nr:DUF3052 domain-containing protein [Candidatus Saccharimonadia bacterium]
MAGYSNKNLIDKLGVRPGARLIVMHAPAGYLDLLGDLDERAKVAVRLAGRFDFIQYFATSTEQLNAVLANLASHLEPGGMLWICWAKRTSPLHTGLTEGIVRELGLKAGLVDVKVAALTDDWSGLKFVYRLADR